MKKTIADTITDKIEKGEIKMKSPFSVWAKKIGINSSIVAIIGLLTFTIGLILYWTNSNSDLLFGGYGNPGLFSFVQSFPYVFMAIFAILFVFLALIFRTFDFSYKKPFFSILLFVAIGILVIGWISIKQQVGQQIYQQEGRFFRMGMMNNKNTVSGIVTKVNANAITIQDEEDNNAIVNLNSNTHFPYGQPKIGDSVRAVGTRVGSTFNALGVRVFDETNPSTLGPGMMRGRGQGSGMMRNR